MIRRQEEQIVFLQQQLAHYEDAMQRAGLALPAPPSPSVSQVFDSDSRSTGTSEAGTSEAGSEETYTHGRIKEKRDSETKATAKDERRGSSTNR